MWRVVLLTIGVSGLQCPVLQCQQEISQICLEMGDGKAVTSTCPAGYTCPTQRLTQLAPQNCTQTQAFPMKINCPELMPLGEYCNATLSCESGAYCDSELQQCAKWKRKGQRCQSTKHCRFGTVCSIGRCVEMWSVPPFEPATSVLACSSARLKAGICLEESVTLGVMPKKCVQDSECSSSLGLPGKCSCGLNSQGAAYCSPHQSDPIVKELLTAVREGKRELAQAWALQVLRYSEVEGSDACGSSLLPTSQVIEELKAQTCKGLLLLLFPFFLA